MTFLRIYLYRRSVGFTVKNAIRESRDMAATQIMLESQGTQHDIMAQAMAAKAAQAGVSLTP